MCHSVRGVFSYLLQGSHLHKKNSFAAIKHSIKPFTRVQHYSNSLNPAKCLHQIYDSFSFILNIVLILISSLKPLCAQSNNCCVASQEGKGVLKNTKGKGVRMFKMSMSCSSVYDQLSGYSSSAKLVMVQNMVSCSVQVFSFKHRSYLHYITPLSSSVM